MYSIDIKAKNQYYLSENEIEFISELLYKLNTESIWKKIKNIDNRNYDGFVQFYKKPLTEKG